MSSSTGCKSFFLAAFALAAYAPRAEAQHAGHGAAPAAHATVPDDAERGGPATSRDASGTAWVPDSTPVHGIHARVGALRLMLHGQLHAGVNWQGTDRGDREAISTNWFMAMASGDVSGGELTARTMLSLEPLTVGADGYALLLQSGEVYQGERLVDRQHPHDLFMELAAQYRRPIAGGVGVELYGGPVGEPAIGPAAFPHRASAMPNPVAPLGHHWLDSTHISFGVVTAGVTTSWAKLEGSWFNGREPDQDRYDLEWRGFDSYATRLSIAPHRNLSLQGSWAFLASPESLEPEISVQRATASATYNLPLPSHGNLAATAAWGRNVPDEGPSTDAALVEAAFSTGPTGMPFVRAELLEKTGEELGLDGAMDDDVFGIAGASLGYLYELSGLGDLTPGIGVVGTAHYVPDDALAARYGDSLLVGGMAYVTLRPAAAPSHGKH